MAAMLGAGRHRNSETSWRQASGGHSTREILEDAARMKWVPQLLEAVIKKNEQQIDTNPPGKADVPPAFQPE